MYRNFLGGTHVIDLTCGSLHTRTFEGIHLSVLRYRLFKNGHRAEFRDTSGTFSIGCSAKYLKSRESKKYRPRATEKNKLSTPLFFSKFSKSLEELFATHSKLILAGDFNFHVDNSTNTRKLPRFGWSSATC